MPARPYRRLFPDTVSDRIGTDPAYRASVVASLPIPPAHGRATRTPTKAGWVAAIAYLAIVCPALWMVLA